MKKVAFYTLGCKVNIFDTESVANIFKNAEYERVDFNDFADVYVINTCTVTNESDRKSRQIIRRAIKRNSGAIIIVMGCYSQTKYSEVAEIDGVDLILGINDKHRVLEYIEEVYTSKKQVKAVGDVFSEKNFVDMDISEYDAHTRAFYKIQEGCQNFCSYCIIPYARGVIRSQKPDLVIANLQKLVNNGYKEVVLTGIHTGAYGLDLEDFNLTNLLIDIEEQVIGLKRLRISSIEINEITNEMLEAIKKSKIVAKSLHIPLQSGSDTILNLMERKYSALDYLKKINSFRGEIEGLTITTDIILGFPHESDDLFLETVETVKKCNFIDAHLFPYSKRDGTKASQMKGQIVKEIKKQRVDMLKKVIKDMRDTYISKKINENLELEVLIEKNKDGYAYGYSQEYFEVKIKGEFLIGNFIKVNSSSYDGKYIIAVKK